MAVSKVSKKLLSSVNKQWANNKLSIKDSI